MLDRGFERLFARHAQGLFAFLVYRTGDRELAEDIAADTFEKILSGRAKFDPRRGREKAWLYPIALNCLRDHARHQAVEEHARELVLAGGAPEVAPSWDEHFAEHDALMAAMRTLSPGERAVVALRFGADLPVAEIAGLLDQPLPRIRNRLYRALGKLRLALEAEEI